MKISLNEIKKYVTIPAEISTDELIKLIGSRLVEVEGTLDLAPKYQGIYVVKVMECEPIPDTHLHLCQIDAGQEQLVQVVCGAPNVHKGMLAVWIAPGSIVPSTYGEENFKLEVRPLRGYDSHGMLAAADELDLGPDHAGIAEIDPDLTWLAPDGKGGRRVQPGDAFADVFELNDIILDIENKSLTHRPDCFGLIGFAREVAGILGLPFDEPEFLTHETVFPEGFLVNNAQNGVSSVDCPIKIELPNPTLCPRYTCAVVELDDATTDSKYLTPSDVFLAKAGMHGISKIVDVSNLLMLQTGQPLHTFDYDKFLAVGGTKTPKIGVRLAKDGEELQLLDGKTIQCTTNDILITSNDVPVALAGAMGGANTEIDSSIRRVLIESASFSLYNLRKTQMHHGIFSEAITRFTKGVPAGGTFNVLAEAVKYLGGTATAVCDNFSGYQKPTPITVSISDINSLLGTDYDAKLIIRTLRNVGIICEGPSEANVMSISYPYWRTDLHIKEDITEEVGRLLGYDNIVKTFPTKPFIGASKDPLLQLKTTIRHYLSDNLAAHELLTYSFVSQALQTKVGEHPKDSYQIVNSLSPDLQCFRQSIVPSLLEKTYDNLRAGHQDFALYELNQVANKKDGTDEEQVPIMHHHLGLVVTGDYYQAKAYIMNLLQALRLTPTIQPSKQSAPFFELAHTADLYLGQQKLGSVGEVRASVLRQFKLPQPIAAAELDLAAILAAQPNLTQSFNLSKFPAVARDLTVKVPAETAHQQIQQAIQQALQDTPHLLATVTPGSIYQNSPQTKNLSFHLQFAHTKQTLTSQEISAIMETIAKAVQKLGAEVI